MFGYDDAITGIGQLGLGLYNKYFNKPKNPADTAQGYLNKIPGMAQGTYNPYIEEGKQYSDIGGIYKNMYENPGDFYNKLASGYKQSPAYQQALKEAMTAIGHQSAAGGKAGAPETAEWAGQKAGELAEADLQQYIDNLLGITDRGTKGAESGMNRGFEASKNLADILAQTYGTQAGYGYAGTAGENQTNARNMSNIFGGAANIFPWLFNQDNKTPTYQPGSGMPPYA